MNAPTLIPPDSILQLKVTLEVIKPSIWRRIHIEAAASLLDLHAALQVAMGWRDAHLHQFEIGHERYGNPDLMDDPSVLDERRMPLFQAFEAGAHAIYEYDFGDAWSHRVELEEVLPRNARLRYPRCVDGARKCPPEDSGGPHFYGDLLAALANPRHPRHAEMLEVAGSHFNPESFNLQDVNTGFSVAIWEHQRRPSSSTKKRPPRALKPPAPEGPVFHHLAIQVNDLPRAERFYCDVLGLAVQKRWAWDDGRPGERSLWLSLEPGFLALEACDQPAPSREFRDPKAGLHLIAIGIRASDRAAWEARLGVAIVHRTKFTLYVRDPEGNRIGLSHHPDEAP
jgi:catechol 2,3-dioxygenase-like lactoylglutathione lyase family enzyme